MYLAENKLKMFWKLLRKSIFPLLVLLLGYMTYFYNYDYPSNLFWDENYHIASAEKYLQWVFFMEPHPPLWKLFIALWEKISWKNNHLDKSEFVKTDYIKSVPKWYSFDWVRLFPALFWMLSAVLFYFIFYYLLKNKYLALLFSWIYLFENGFIIQSRSAMLDSTQVFFLLLPILYFVYRISKDKIVKLCDYLILWLLIWLAVSVKVNSAVLFLLPVFFVLYDFIFHKVKLFDIKNIWLYFFKSIVYLFWFLFTFSFVRYIHVSIWKTPADGNVYQASQLYKQALSWNSTSDLIKFPQFMLEHVDFIAHYQKGVPNLDLCKKWENWSYPLGWVVWNKTINYRREAINNRQAVKYMYFQWNPIVRWSVLFAVVMAISLIISNIFFSLKITNKRLFFNIIVFLSLYLGYMYSVLQIKRVMYLYHYLIPLCFGIILLVLILYYVFEKEFEQTQKIKVWSNEFPINYLIWFTMILYIILIFIVYLYFSPFTYYTPLTENQFYGRSWFDFRWLKVVK